MQEPTDKEEIGLRLAFMREKLKLGTQREFAAVIGFDWKRYNNWETGVARLPIEAAVAIVRHVPVDFDYLYRGELSGLTAKVMTLLRPPAPPSPVVAKGRKQAS